MHMNFTRFAMDYLCLFSLVCWAGSEAAAASDLACIEETGAAPSLRW